MSGKKIDWVSFTMLGSAAIILLLAVGMLINFMLQPRGTPSPADTFMMTLDATVRANVTNIPHATQLSQADAAAWVQLQSQVVSCADYMPERRSQMLQHIAWLIDPSSIPPDTISAFGTNVQSTLVFGMASYTSIQWRLLDRPRQSCLVQIGQQLDVMLSVFGRTPLGIYDEQ